MEQPIRTLTKGECQELWKRRGKVKEKKSRYFDRQKILSRPYPPPKYPIEADLFFDCETFELYRDPNDPSEQPLIVPYAIGWTYGWPGSYEYLVGVDCVIKFIDDVLQKIPFNKIRILAFNIDYDFQVIRPWLTQRLSRTGGKFHYTMTEDKKFIFGDINTRWTDNKITDLWRWDMSQSLASYMKHISDLVYDDKGNIKDEPISVELGGVLTKFGFTKETFKKQSIDYKKVNFHQGKDGHYYYWNSREDWVNKKSPIRLDLEAELEYLRIDVVSLPIVYQEQRLFRKYIKLLLGIEKPIDKDASITLPGFAKYICEEYTKKYFTETVRRKVYLKDYKDECKSYIGAFVGGHKDITYLDEEVFKQMYPDKSFYDSEGNPRIKSYDVNSMYPWAMSMGLPFGEIWDVPPSDNCVEWVEIHFKDWWDKDNPDPKRRLYDWKEKYAFLNNSFFGANFANGLTPGLSANNRVYVLRETLDLFYEMCDAHVEEVCSRYQELYTELNPFIDTLYEIKANKDKKWPPSTVKMIKLILNSLYGKMCEKYKEIKIQWCNDFYDLLRNHPDYLEEIADLGLVTTDKLQKNKSGSISRKRKPRPQELITPEEAKKTVVKSKITPYMDRRFEESGYFVMPNKDKRYDRFGNECRESILAGAYITYLSRWKLLGAVKQEVDNGNIVLYCDTDSIKFIQFNEPVFETDNTKLGAWKYEGSFTHFGHPNKLKKYFMHNKHETSPKKQWMVKTSGIPTKWLREPNKPFDLEVIKTLYNEENRVLVIKSKTISERNHYWQPVIKDTDFKFVFKDSKGEPTHILEGGVLRKNG